MKVMFEETKGRTRRGMKNVRKVEAEERQAHWDSLSTQEKIDDLDRRLGKGQGAVKQRKRLAKQLEG